MAHISLASEIFGTPKIKTTVGYQDLNLDAQWSRTELFEGQDFYEAVYNNCTPPNPNGHLAGAIPIYAGDNLEVITRSPTIAYHNRVTSGRGVLQRLHPASLVPHTQFLVSPSKAVQQIGDESRVYNHGDYVFVSSDESESPSCTPTPDDSPTTSGTKLVERLQFTQDNHSSRVVFALVTSLDTQDTTELEVDVNAIALEPSAIFNRHISRVHTSTLLPNNVRLLEPTNEFNPQHQATIKASGDSTEIIVQKGTATTSSFGFITPQQHPAAGARHFKSGPTGSAEISSKAGLFYLEHDRVLPYVDQFVAVAEEDNALSGGVITYHPYLFSITYLKTTPFNGDIVKPVNMLRNLVADFDEGNTTSPIRTFRRITVRYNHRGSRPDVECLTLTPMNQEHTVIIRQQLIDLALRPPMVTKVPQNFSVYPDIDITSNTKSHVVQMTLPRDEIYKLNFSQTRRGLRVFQQHTSSLDEADNSIFGRQLVLGKARYKPSPFNVTSTTMVGDTQATRLTVTSDLPHSALPSRFNYGQ